MKHKRSFAILLLALAAALTACGGNGQSSLPEPSDPGSSVVSSEPSSEESLLSRSEAETLAKEQVPLDFNGSCTLTPAEDEELDGSSCYVFAVTGKTELTVLVDKETGAVTTRHTDGSTYPVEDDPAFRTTPTQWGGTYASETGSILTVELMDNNSFEFTLTAGEETLEAQVGRIAADDPSQAESVGKDGVRLYFAKQGDAIRITAEDAAGESFAGEYALDR